MALFGIQINLPFQVQEDYKLKVMAAVSSNVSEVRAPNGEMLTYSDHSLSYTERPAKQFATDDEESAKALASTYDKSWQAEVVPVDEGRVMTGEELAPIIEKEQRNARDRLKAERALGVGR